MSSTAVCRQGGKSTKPEVKWNLPPIGHPFFTYKNICVTECKVNWLVIQNTHWAIFKPGILSASLRKHSLDVSQSYCLWHTRCIIIVHGGFDAVFTHSRTNWDPLTLISPTPVVRPQKARKYWDPVICLCPCTMGLHYQLGLNDF